MLLTGTYLICQATYRPVTLSRGLKMSAAKSKGPSPATEPPAAEPLRAADRILQSARDLFYREGIRAVGVDEIVARAGVTKPSLYRSFPSKDELAATYLRRYEAEFWER